MKKIKIRCKGSTELALADLHILQDVEDKFELKELSTANFERLKTSIEKRGFWFPFFVWYDKKDKKN